MVESRIELEVSSLKLPYRGRPAQQGGCLFNLNHVEKSPSVTLSLDFVSCLSLSSLPLTARPLLLFSLSNCPALFASLRPCGHCSPYSRAGLPWISHSPATLAPFLSNHLLPLGSPLRRSPTGDGYRGLHLFCDYDIKELAECRTLVLTVGQCQNLCACKDHPR